MSSRSHAQQHFASAPPPHTPRGKQAAAATTEYPSPTSPRDADEGGGAADEQLARATEQMSMRDAGSSSYDRPVKGEPDACLFVASLNAQRTDEQLTESVTRHFAQWGRLLNVKVMKDWMNRPYAFVQYGTTDDALRALDESHDTIVDGRHVRVEQARVNRTLFLAKLPKTMTEEAMQRYLEKWGKVEDVTLLTNPATNKSKGCCFAKFRYREDAIRAYLHIRQQAKWAVEWAANIEKHKPDTDRHSVFVGSLNPRQVSEAALQHRFGQYGAIESIHLFNTTGEAFAFLRFEDEESAQAAIDGENGREFQSATLRVQFRETPDARAPRKPLQGGAGGGSTRDRPLHRGPLSSATSTANTTPAGSPPVSGPSSPRGPHQQQHQHQHQHSRRSTASGAPSAGAEQHPPPPPLQFHGYHAPPAEPAGGPVSSGPSGSGSGAGTSPPHPHQNPPMPPFAPNSPSAIAAGFNPATLYAAFGGMLPPMPPGPPGTMPFGAAYGGAPPVGPHPPRGFPGYPPPPTAPPGLGGAGSPQQQHSHTRGSTATSSSGGGPTQPVTPTAAYFSYGGGGAGGGSVPASPLAPHLPGSGLASPQPDFAQFDPAIMAAAAAAMGYLPPPTAPNAYAYYAAAAAAAAAAAHAAAASSSSGNGGGGNSGPGSAYPAVPPPNSSTSRGGGGGGSALGLAPSSSAATNSGGGDESGTAASVHWDTSSSSPLEPGEIARSPPVTQSSSRRAGSTGASTAAAVNEPSAREIGMRPPAPSKAIPIVPPHKHGVAGTAAPVSAPLGAGSGEKKAASGAGTGGEATAAEVAAGDAEE
ncbi:hypothetical protein H9P43_008847 [Blastocladiella emersonii ATCC 22665]|nr:hypothetical protein H9P43_008847 [Blastocladiella emersonii ATCC 22665]